MTMARRAVRAGLLCGVIDGMWAVGLTLISGRTILELFQGIAASVPGTGHLEGVPSALLGLGIHFGVAFTWSGVFLALVAGSRWDRHLQASKPSDNEIQLTRTFAAPREAIFAALTQAEHLVYWMKSADMELVTCEADVRVGGKFRYEFQRPNGRKLEVRGVYAVVDPPYRVSYTETYDFSPLKVVVTTVLDESDGETVLHQNLRYSSKRERDEDFDGVTTSAEDAFSKLDRYFEQLQRHSTPDSD